MIQRNEADSKSVASPAPKGILNSIYTKVSGHPQCEILVHYPQAGLNYLTAGDDLKGKIQIKTSVEG